MQNGINKRSGAHIAIENNTKIPSIVSKGLSVMPGAEANIGFCWAIKASWAFSSIFGLAAASPALAKCWYSPG